MRLSPVLQPVLLRPVLRRGVFAETVVRAAQAAAGMRLGMNLAGITTYDGAYPFANLCFNGGNWVLVSGTATYTQDQGNLNVSSVTGTAVFSMAIGSSAGDGLQTGTYTLLNPDARSVGTGNGQGNTSYTSGYITATSQTFNYTAGNGMFLNLQVTAPGVYKDFAVILPGHLTSWQAGDYFNSAFVSYHTGMNTAVIRAMDWTSMNTNIETDWTDRSVSGKTTFLASALTPTVPWEVIVAAANRLNRDLWLNVPVRATQAYVNSLAAYVAANLNSNLKVYVETANEVTFNTSSVFASGYNWIQFLNHTRLSAAVDAATGVITRASHGLANGATLSGWVTRTTRTKQIDDSANPAPGLNYYTVCRGHTVYVGDVTTNTFKVYTDAARTIPVTWATGVTDWVYVVQNEAGKSTDQYANYASLALRNWTAFDTAFGGTSRVKAVLGSHAAGTSKTTSLLAATGIAARVDAVAIAPYAYPVWLGAAIDVASGQLTPKFWSNIGGPYVAGSASVTFRVYPDASNPTDPEILTGTGAIGSSSYSASYGARVNAAVTISNASPAVVTWDTRAPAAGKTVVLSTTGALPTGLAPGTTYYVVNPSGNTFQLAATLGGAAINTSSAGSGTHTATVNYGSATHIDGPSVTGLVNGTTYKVFFVAIDHLGYKWILRGTAMVSATPSTVDVLDTEANQALRSIITFDSATGPFKYVADHLAAIAASPAPACQLVHYEGGMHNDEAAPAAINTWMIAYTESAAFGDVLKRYIRGLAARDVKAHCIFSDVSNDSLSWSTADSYDDTGDQRYIAMSSLAGFVAKLTLFSGTDVTGTAVPTDPNNFPTPTTVATLTAGLTYTILKGNDTGNFQVSGNLLQMVNDVGVDWAAPTTQQVTLRATDGLLDEVFVVSFTTGSAWYEGDAQFALNMTEQADAATLTARRGGNLPRTTGSGGTFVGGLLDEGGANAHTSTTGLAASLNLANQCLFAVVIDKDDQATNFQTMVQFGGSSFVSLQSVNATNMQWRYHSGAADLITTALMNWSDNVKAVYWLLLDQPNGRFHYGKNQTDLSAGGTALASWQNTIARNVNLNATQEQKGSIEVVNRSGLTLTQALAIVQKIQTLHGIA